VDYVLMAKKIKGNTVFAYMRKMPIKNYDNAHNEKTCKAAFARLMATYNNSS
jgi:hypothetical protein